MSVIPLVKKKRKQIRKKVVKDRTPKTPSQVAQKIRSMTENNQPVGASVHKYDTPTNFYNKEKFLEDKNNQDSSMVFESDNVRKNHDTRSNYSLAHAESIAALLLEYSMKPTSKDVIGFLKSIGLPYTTFFGLRDKYGCLHDAYELAMVNLMTNNKQWLEDNSTFHAAQLAVSFVSRKDPFMREDTDPFITTKRMQEEKRKVYALEELSAAREKAVLENKIQVTYVSSLDEQIKKLLEKQVDDARTSD